MDLIVIYGPPGSGKTLNGEALRQHFGCDAVLDEGQQALSSIHSLKAESVLALVCDPTPLFSMAGMIIKIETAAKALGDKWVAPRVELSAGAIARKGWNS